MPRDPARFPVLVFDMSLLRCTRGKVVARLMGHTNADVTLNVYTHVLNDSLRSP